MIPYVLVTLGVFARFIPHPPNFTPITALALYSGTHLSKRYAILIPLGALFLSDVIKGFYPGMAYVYGSFLVIGALGFWLRKHPEWSAVIGTTLLGSVFFYVVTCYGSWLQGAMAGTTFFQDLMMSLPFYRNMLAGDLMYVGILFGIHRIASLSVENKPALRKILFSRETLTA